MDTPQSPGRPTRHRVSDLLAANAGVTSDHFQKVNGRISDGGTCSWADNYTKIPEQAGSYKRRPAVVSDNVTDN